jgi:tetratricopeptide (TPR) repeat protein
VVPLLDVQANRILYPMLPGLSLAMGTAILGIARPRWLPSLVTTVTALVLAVMSVHQIGYWLDPIRLWERDTAYAPSRWRPWVNYTVELAEHGRWREATSAIGKAEALAPDNPTVLYNAAAIAAARTDGRRDPSLARRKLAGALRSNPTHARSLQLLLTLNRNLPPQ